MTRWTTDEDDKLKAAAEAGFTLKEAAPRVGRSEPACAARANKLSVRFGGAGVAALRNHHGATSAEVRDDFGGAVGVQWRDARRNGEAFSPAACEAMLAAGRLKLKPGATAAYGFAS